MRTVNDGDSSSLIRIVKNSRTGPPPSTAGSPSNVIFIGTVKSKSRCLNKATLSSKTAALHIVTRFGAPGVGCNCFRSSLRLSPMRLASDSPS
jgi:hypothetical protein